MTEPDSAATNPGATNIGTSNIAGAGSNIGIQAEQVHNSPVYQVLPDAPPERKYKVGVRYLEHGVPRRALDLINDAIANGYTNSEVLFHWALATLSKRSYRDLTPEERAELNRITTSAHTGGDDEWNRAIKTVGALLDRFNHPRSTPGQEFDDLNALPPGQRAQIVRHLDLVLAGGTKEKLWGETRQAAKDNRLRNDRLNSVWAYFEPKPAGARARQPAPDPTNTNDRRRAITLSVLFVSAVGYLGWLVLQHTTLLPILAYLLALPAGYTGANHAWEWHYRTRRLALKDHAYFNQQKINRAPQSGFTDGVDRAFTHYFNRYVPKNTDRARWLARTGGLRNTLRNEIAEIYRESRTDADQVRWLIRYLVGDVRRQWEDGTLFKHRELYRVESNTKVICCLSLTTLALMAGYIFMTAAQEATFTSAITILVTLTSGRAAARQWMQIRYERRRFEEDRLEYARNIAARETAYHRWKNKLDSIRPTEDAMESWLNCDKTIVLSEALDHYRLTWSDIISYAFLATPLKNYKRARVNGGPWRYSKYDIRLFLITRDGVREVSTELDFEHATLNGHERNNFRFDAVSSVHVTRIGTTGYTLELTLVSGPVQTIRITDPAARQFFPGENTETLSKINLDAAGFTHALHILEGIAAEGKGWIRREPGRAA